MKYQGYDNFDHAQADKVGVLITNLGTPDAPTTGALRKYLKQFLWDPRVVEVPRPVWWLILNGIILNIRPRKSAEAYRNVWTEQGSPLALYTEKQASALKEKLSAAYGDRVLIEWGMRYGSPSIATAVENLLAKGARKLVVLPLYPQYSGSTSGSTFDAIAEDFRQRRWLPELRFINSYCGESDYIEALATSISTYWDEHGRADKLVLSYHGVPQRYLHKGDPYHCQCHKTTRLVADALGLKDDEYITTFQSRFGREPWLQPYTDETMKQLPKQGVKRVQVVCPGFSSDCLETIEEIGMENRDYFLEAGGESFSYIPALNDRPEHISALFSLIAKNLAGWLELPDDDTAQRQARFQTHTHNKA